MPTLVFRLRNVPDDEAIAVRQLLDTHHIAWYETTAGNWGIAMPGIWVKNDGDTEQARHLIDEYQIERQKKVRSDYLQKRQTGQAPSFSQHIKKHPFRVLGIVVFCVFVLYAMISPFLQLIDATAGTS